MTKRYEETLTAAVPMVSELADFDWLNSLGDEYTNFPQKYAAHRERAAAFKEIFKRFLEAAKERAGSTA